MAKSFTITLFSILYFLIFSLIDARNGSYGFSFDLIHRDSPKSPLHNLSQTPSDRISKALTRSINRLNYFYPASRVKVDTIKSQIITVDAEYFMEMSIGTPKYRFLALADTGSDLIWTQCKPCPQCFKQDSPLFDPKSSRTYKNVTCGSSQCKSLEERACKQCKSLEGRACRSSNDTCPYKIKYGDDSFSEGQLAFDTFWLESTNGRPLPFPNRIFGCSHHTPESFDKISTGIIGLGAGKFSLISQLSHVIEGKFSYCLISFAESKNSSKLRFGSQGAVSGPGVVSTPVLSTIPYYNIRLEAITIGHKRIELEDSNHGRQDEGNIIIDSGTTVTWLDTKFYAKLEEEMSKAIHGPKRIPDPNNFYGLCYIEDVTTIKVPSLTVHFKGADVKLKPINYFVQVSETIVCFSFKGTSDGAIYGNLAQVNFLIGYDIGGRKISFKHMDCTKHV